jgi:hypothetical protein
MHATLRDGSAHRGEQFFLDELSIVQSTAVEQKPNLEFAVARNPDEGKV